MSGEVLVRGCGKWLLRDHNSLICVTSGVITCMQARFLHRVLEPTGLPEAACTWYASKDAAKFGNMHMATKVP